MLIEFLGVILLLGLIIIPLMPRKAKTKSTDKAAGFKINTDTHDAEYAINANGKLERIHGTSLIND